MIELENCVFVNSSDIDVFQGSMLLKACKFYNINSRNAGTCFTIIVYIAFKILKIIKAHLLNCFIWEILLSTTVPFKRIIFLILD